MAIKILTKNSIENTNIDGARANNFNAGRRSGIVKGVLNEGRFFASSSNVIALDTCELRLCGHRVVIDSIEYKTFTNTPSSDIRYSLVAQISVDINADVTFALNTQLASTALVQNNLDETGVGVYELEIGRFTLNTSGEIEDVVRTADIITGGTGQGGESGNLNIGTVTTTTLAAGLDAEVDIENRYNPQDNKTYTDFSFSIPQGASGSDGDDGIDSLMTGIMSYSQPASNDHFYVPNFLNGFNRVPRQGDRFIMLHRYNSKTYIASYLVNSCTLDEDELGGEMYIQLLVSQEITGPQGEKGDKGDTGATGPQGPQGTSVTITTTSGSESISDGTNTLSFGSNAFNSTTIPTTTDSVTQSSTAALTSGGAYTALSGKQDSLPTTTTAGQLLKSTSTSGTFALGNSLPYLTTAPSAANNDGLILVVLSSEPATRYSGYIYIITSS